jgi:hypothetical protein
MLRKSDSQKTLLDEYYYSPIYSIENVFEQYLKKAGSLMTLVLKDRIKPIKADSSIFLW